MSTPGYDLPLSERRKAELHRDVSLNPNAFCNDIIKARTDGGYSGRYQQVGSVPPHKHNAAVCALSRVLVLSLRAVTVNSQSVRSSEAHGPEALRSEPSSSHKIDTHDTRGASQRTGLDATSSITTSPRITNNTTSTTPSNSSSHSSSTGTRVAC
jgi:hypothetical protein